MFIPLHDITSRDTHKQAVQLDIETLHIFCMRSPYIRQSILEASLPPQFDLLFSLYSFPLSNLSLIFSTLKSSTAQWRFTRSTNQLFPGIKCLCKVFFTFRAVGVNFYFQNCHLPDTFILLI